MGTQQNTTPVPTPQGGNPVNQPYQNERGQYKVRKRGSLSKSNSTYAEGEQNHIGNHPFFERKSGEEVLPRPRRDKKGKKDTWKNTGGRPFKRELRGLGGTRREGKAKKMENRGINGNKGCCLGK